MHQISDANLEQTLLPDRSIQFRLTATLDGKTLHATHTASANDLHKPGHRDTILNALGVQFSVELGKRLGAIHDTFATPKGR